MVRVVMGECQEGFGDKESWSFMDCTWEGASCCPCAWLGGGVLSLCPLRCGGSGHRLTPSSLPSSLHRLGLDGLKMQVRAAGLAAGFLCHHSCLWVC